MAGTSALPASRSSKLVVVIEPGFIGSLKRAVGEVPTLIPAAPGVGVVAEIVGGVVSGVMLRAMSACSSATVRARL